MVLLATPEKRNKTVTVINRTVDICQYLKRRNGADIFVKIVYDRVSEHGNFAKKCPIEKFTKYYFNDFEVKEELFPLYIPKLKATTSFSINYWTKKGKKFIPVVNTKVIGGIYVL